MITGSKKITKEDIEKEVQEVLRYTNDGYDIYRYYLNEVKRVMQRPWPGEKRERNISWGVYYYNGTYIWNDNAREEKGNAITFVQRYFSLSFKEAMDKIKWDFGIGGKDTERRVVINWKAPSKEERKEYSHISFTHKPWKDEHHKFYAGTGVDESHALKWETYALKDAAVNRRRIILKPNEVAWAYYHPEQDAVKLYFPERETFRWWTNVEGTTLWGMENVGECDNLVIQKSNKDRLIHLLYNPNVICPQNEKTTIFDRSEYPEIVGEIEMKCARPTVFFGSDEDGRKKSGKIISLTGWREVYTPLGLMPDINDLYGYAKRYGPEETYEFLKENKLL